MRQLELFVRSTAPPPTSDLPDPGEIRVRMQAVLDELTAADIIPWSERKLETWRTVWPQMSRWLPEQEQSELTARFEEQMVRLGAFGQGEAGQAA